MSRSVGQNTSQNRHYKYSAYYVTKLDIVFAKAPKVTILNNSVGDGSHFTVKMRFAVAMYLQLPWILSISVSVNHY